MVKSNRNSGFFSRLLSFRKGIAAVLLLLFGLITANNALYQHRHVLADGTVIVHAHPFKTNPDGSPVKHTHTANEYVLLSTVFQAVYLGAQSISLKTLVILSFVSVLTVYISHTTVPVSMDVPSMRGPPSCYSPKV